MKTQDGSAIWKRIGVMVAVIGALVCGQTGFASGPVTTYEQAMLELAVMAERNCASSAGGYEYAEYKIWGHSDGKFSGIFRCFEGREPDLTYAAEIQEDGRTSWVLVNPMESFNVR